MSDARLVQIIRELKQDLGVLERAVPALEKTAPISAVAGHGRSAVSGPGI